MSDLKPEVTEPDPSATTISNDETVNKNGGDASAPTDVSAEVAEVKATEPAAEKAQNGDEKTENGEKKVDGDEKKEENGASNERRRGGDRGGYNKRSHNDSRGNDRYPRRKNNKFDPSALEVSDDPKKIRSQVEFYFGDSNLPVDRFLWEQTDGAENKPVPVQVIHKFKRMQVFQPYSAVVEALKSSPFLVIEGEEGQETVRRKTAYDPNSKDPREPRTVYVKGFGEEKPTTQFDIEAFFTNYGTTKAVRLRRHHDGPDKGLFKGSVFVEFEDEETATKFLELDPAPKWEGKDDLKIMSKIAYMEEKTQLIQDGKMEPNETKPRFNGPKSGGRGRGRGGNDSRDRDPNDWKKRREDDQKSGFRNDRRGGGRGRGGHGGRGRGDGNRRSRDNDRNEEKDAANETSTKAAVDPSAAANYDNEKKRARDDGDSSEVPTKKQDTKEAVPAES